MTQLNVQEHRGAEDMEVIGTRVVRGEGTQ